MSDPKQKTIIDNESNEADIVFPGTYVQNESDEEQSDGSGNAFEETERVDEDNFDDLKEK